MHPVFIGMASYFYVGAKSFQQLSVAFKKFKWVPVMSYVMAAMEIFIITGIVSNPSFWTWICLGTGSFLGCWTSMYIHPILTGKGWGDKKSNNNSSQHKET